MESGVAAQDYESKVKRSKYEVACREQGLHFVPMVVEVFGTWGKEATPVMDIVSKAVAHQKKLTYEQVDVSQAEAQHRAAAPQCSRPAQAQGS